MIVTSLLLEQFRTYTKRKFTFSPNITVLSGANAIGKTNILESLVMLSTGRSFRAVKDIDTISWNCQYARIQSDLIDGKNIELFLAHGDETQRQYSKKRLFVNGIPKRLYDFTGIMKTVLFWPEHVELVIGSPSTRRKYLDSVLVQVDREYTRTLLSYEKGLRQRNKVLEKIHEGIGNRQELWFWDQLLIKAGTYLTMIREEFIRYINTTSSQDFPYRLEYDKSVISESRLAQYSHEEVFAHMTLVGPHRDDFHFYIGKESSIKTEQKTQIQRDVSQFGSRGEQRIAVLWLKLGELAFMKDKTQDLPLLLLDDIFSELDDIHRRLVWKHVGNQQTIIASADLHEIPKHVMQHVEVIHLK